MNTTKKTLGFAQASIALLLIIVLLAAGSGYFGFNVEMLMLIATIFVAIIAIRLGYTWDEIMDSIIKKLSQALPTIFIVVIIGLLIGSWMIGGTIPIMIFYGLKIINPSFLLITSFLVACCVSVCVGTSWGTVGTIGVALIGVATAMDIPLPIAAGAVISGAYFGDKMSPLSDTTNLSAMSVGVNLYEHIRHMFYTTIPSFVVCCVAYIAIGFSLNTAAEQADNLSSVVMATIDQIYNLNIFAVIPIIIIIYGSVRRKPTIPVMILSSAVAFLNAIIFQGFSIAQCFKAGLNGFNVNMINTPGFDVEGIAPEILTLLNRGGMLSMTGILLIAFCAFAFGGTLKLTKIIEIVLQRVMGYVKTVGGLITATLISGIVCLGVTGHGALTALLIGDSFKSSYTSRNLDPKNLSRTLEDSVSIVDPLFPWTASGVYMATTLGVPTLEYLPWAFFCYLGIFTAIILGYTGFGIAKLNPQQKTEN